MRTLGHLLRAALVGALIAVAASAADAPKQRYDIPAGDAAAALKQFSAASGRETLFAADAVRGVRTAAVRGELTAQEAIAALLGGTGLVAETDAKTGAIAVRRDTPVEAKNAPSRPAERAAAEEAGARIRDGVVQLDAFEVFGSKSINLDLPRTRDDAQPYVVFSGEQIAQAQVANLQDFFRSRLPMATNIGLSTFAGGSAFSQSVNLRGIGTNQTLILVDGRRLPTFVVPGSLGGPITPDINGIPMSAIERIEVLPSTASGIYGGGATGGVINIITRKDYSGGEVTLNYVNTFDTDAARRRADLNFSTSLRGGATVITLTGSWQDANALLTQDRDFAVRARRSAFANNPAIITGATNPPRGYTTNIRSRNGANLVLKPEYGGLALPSFFTSVPVGYTGIASDNAAALVTNAGRYNLELPSDQRGGRSFLTTKASPLDSVGLAVRQKMTSWLEGYLDYQRNVNRAASSSLASSQISGRFTLAAAAPNNPFTTAVNVSYPFTGLWSNSRTENTVTRVTGGLVAKLPGDWQAGLDYVWGRSAYRNVLDAPLLRSTFGTALSSGVLDALRDLNARPFDYQPYLVSGQILDDTGGSRTSAFTLRASGPTVRLPAGPLVVSASGEWREDRTLASVSSTTNASAATPNYAYTPELTGEGHSGYVEAKVPLLAASDSRSKRAQFEAQVAGRYDSFSATTLAAVEFPSVPSKAGPFPDVPMQTRNFSATSFTAGLRYVPVQDLVLRASFGTGFLAPNTSQLIGPRSFPSFLSLSDPKRGGVPQDVGPVDYRLGGNPNLKPEKSNSYSAGFIYTPRYWSGFRLSVDYTKIEKTDEITFLTDQQLIDYEDSLATGSIVRAPLTAADAAAGYTGGVITAMTNLARNIARREVEAIDFQADYNRKTVMGEFSIYAVATWNRRFASRVVPSDALLNQVGYLSSPLRWKGNAGFNWNLGSWKAGWNAQYYDSQFVYTSTSRALSASTVLTQGADRWPSQFYHDLFVGYEFGRNGENWRRPLSGVQITVGLQNVFNREPPLRAGVDEMGGFQNIEDPRLRRYSLTFRKPF